MSRLLSSFLPVRMAAARMAVFRIAGLE